MKNFSSELKYKTARSSGKGGQNVNKVETMVEVLWEVQMSLFFTDEEKELIEYKLANRINKEGVLSVRSSESRSQLENKELAIKKILDLVNKALVVPKARKTTKVPKSVKEKRLQNKKKISEIKKIRNKKNWE